MLSIALLALFFAARGAGTSKWCYILGSALTILIEHHSWDFIAYMWVCIAMGCFATKPLLALTFKNQTFGEAMRSGFVRSIPIIPSIMFLQNPWMCLLFLHGVFYYLTGQILTGKYYPSATRISEYILGGLIGAIC